MYLSYFGLGDRPFAITPDPRFLYLSERHREALSHLLYGLGEHGGFVQLTGEVGTGKTTLCRYLLERLPPEVDAALILNSRMSATDLVAAICDELRIPVPTGATGIKALVDALYGHLLAAHARGRRTVLIVDEAQNLSADALEQIRMLTNLETPREKLLQIILIGQPELIHLLDRRELRQLAQRITARYHLTPFDPQETRAYVLYRLEVAGQAEPIFEDAALDEVHALSGGVPRLVNVLCDRALLGAYATRRSTVDTAIVRRAADEVLGRRDRSGTRPLLRRRWARVPAAALAVSTIVAAVALSFVVQPGWLLDSVDWARRATANAVVPAAGITTTVADEPAGAAPAMASSLPRAPRPADLATVLGDAALGADRSAVFSRLYALWGVEVDVPDPALPCVAPRGSGLRCFSAQGPWRLLRALDMPAILELVPANGERRYALLTALDGDRAVLDVGTERYAVPVAELDTVWRGDFSLLWRAPATIGVPMGPGGRGPGVAWLRQRLAEVAGRPAPASASQVYDDDLRHQVIDFQLSQFLDPDGIAGEHTLIRLTAALDSRTPSLSAGRTGS